MSSPQFVKEPLRTLGIVQRLCSESNIAEGLNIGGVARQHSRLRSLRKQYLLFADWNARDQSQKARTRHYTFPAWPIQAYAHSKPSSGLSTHCGATGADEPIPMHLILSQCPHACLRSMADPEYKAAGLERTGTVMQSLSLSSI